jgi:hypothetical protein
MTSTGFTAELDALAPVANETLPSVAGVVDAQHKVASAHEGLEGPGTFHAVDPMQRAYARLTDLIGDRLWLGSARIEDTAQVLKEIIDTYRRADGQ